MNVVTADQNSSLTTEHVGLFDHSPYSWPVNIVLLTLSAVLIVWIVLSNITVIMAVRYTKVLRSRLSNISICNLALSDLLLGLFILPLSAINDVFGFWLFGREICYMWLLIGKLQYNLPDFRNCMQ